MIQNLICHIIDPFVFQELRKRFLQAALSAEILCLDRALTNQMYLLSDGTLLFTEGAVMEDSDGLRLETTSADNRILTYPKGAADLPFASAFLSLILPWSQTRSPRTPPEL